MYIDISLKSFRYARIPRIAYVCIFSFNAHAQKMYLVDLSQKKSIIIIMPRLIIIFFMKSVKITENSPRFSVDFKGKYVNTTYYIKYGMGNFIGQFQISQYLVACPLFCKNFLIKKRALGELQDGIRSQKNILVSFYL